MVKHFILNVLDVEYVTLKNKNCHIYASSYGPLGPWLDIDSAKEECSNDIHCGGVLNHGCGDQDFYLCVIGSIYGVSNDTCGTLNGTHQITDASNNTTHPMTVYDKIGISYLYLISSSLFLLIMSNFICIIYINCRDKIYTSRTTLWKNYDGKRRNMERKDLQIVSIL